MSRKYPVDYSKKITVDHGDSWILKIAVPGGWLYFDYGDKGAIFSPLVPDPNVLSREEYERHEKEAAEAKEVSRRAMQSVLQDKEERERDARFPKN